jgi:dTDP-4-amino-4,6-dideoxygalactose transaminase
VLDIRKLTVGGTSSLLQAMDKMNLAGEGVLLLVDPDNRLRRTVTDGDLRRLVLAGSGLDVRLDALPAHTPITAREDISAGQALALMNERGIDHLPLVDAKGRPVELLLRRELDARILLSAPHLGEEELGFVQEAFRTNWVAPLGPNVDAFEQEIASTLGVAHAAALSSGTAALHLALRLLAIGHGDEVFCSTFTFVASANPILYQGARPVFIDSEPTSWNMSPAALGNALDDARRRGRLPKAVLVTNLYGQSADMDPLLELCRRYGIPMVEDAAESLGATYRGKSSGSFGCMAALSFNGNKIITTSGGGMLVSNDRELIEKARFLSTQAREPVAWYEHTEVGYNYRMSNVLAGIGRGQLRLLAQRVAARRGIYERYRGGLGSLAGLGWMPEAAFGRCTRWLSVCTLDPQRSPVTSAELIASLARAGIEARHVWKPMHLQPLFDGCRYFTHQQGASFSDMAFQQGICLPSGSNLAPKQQDRIIDGIHRIFERAAERGVAKAL